MTIKWNGHASFTITLSDGRKIITDPFDASVGYETVKEDADIVTISHQHHDHNHVESLKSCGVCLTEEGTYQYDALTIRAAHSYHDEVMGQKRGSNLLFRIEAEGKTIVHLGDVGHIVNEEQLEFIREADVLLIPIGGTYTITADEAIKIIDMSKPKAVIPMHFKTEHLAFPLSDEKEFAKKTGAVYANQTTLDVNDIKNTVILNYR